MTTETGNTGKTTGETIAQLADAVGVMDRRARALSREHPFLALGGAVLVGFLVGRVASRS